MQDLINLIVQTVGITEDQAKKTIDTVLGYTRRQLPAPIAAQVDTFIANGGAMMIPGLADLLKGFSEVGMRSGRV